MRDAKQNFLLAGPSSGGLIWACLRRMSLDCTANHQVKQVRTSFHGSHVFVGADGAGPFVIQRFAFVGIRVTRIRKRTQGFAFRRIKQCRVRRFRIRFMSLFVSRFVVGQHAEWRAGDVDTAALLGLWRIPHWVEAVGWRGPKSWICRTRQERGQDRGSASAHRAASSCAATRRSSKSTSWASTIRSSRARPRRAPARVCSSASR